MWELCVCFLCSLHYVLSSFAIILTRKSDLLALPLLSFVCRVIVNFLWHFLTVLWVGLQFVIVLCIFLSYSATFSTVQFNMY